MSETEVKQVEDKSLDRRTLFVRSVPFDATNEQLSDYFSQFSPVKHAVIVYDNEKNSRGFGFVSFATDADALTALTDSKKTKFNGSRLLRVDVAKRRDRKADSASATSQSKSKKSDSPANKVLLKSAKLIIRNLPWSVRDSEELKKIFNKYGPVKDAHIPRGKGGKMTGFGFVTMSKHAIAAKVVKDSVGLKIGDREVAVDFAVDKKTWEQHKEDEEPEEEPKEEVEEDEDNDDNDDNEDTEMKDDDSKSEKVDSDNEDKEDDENDENDEDEEDDEDKHDLKMLGLDDDDDEEEDRPKANRQEKFTIFIRNLPYDATQEALTEHFTKFGPIKYALPVIDKATGLAKGTGFVAFHKSENYEDCLLNAPEVNPNSMLIPDDVSPLYVYEGRILQVAPAVDRDSAQILSERNALARKELLGRAPGETDKRNLFLLNEGRITSNSKLASVITNADLMIREKSYNQRVQQLNKNPSLHISFTRLAIRNLPRSMNEKSLKALGRKAIVEFATEVKEEKRHGLSREEINRSTRLKKTLEEKLNLTEEQKRKARKHGVVKQAKVINEVKDSGEFGRSRGYGFLEFKDHRHALMGLRWLNAHEVTQDEALAGLEPEQVKAAQSEGLAAKRRLIAEFAIENANVVKRRFETMSKSRYYGMKRKNGEVEKDEDEKKQGKYGNGKGGDNKRSKKDKFNKQRGNKRGNMNKGASQGKPEADNKQDNNKSGLSNNVKSIIGKKRKQRKQGK